MNQTPKPGWWGGSRHRLYTVGVFIILVSLDNAARSVFPPLYAVMARSLAVSEAALGLVTAQNILVVAVTAVGWGYWGDRGDRKRLLLVGTLIWSTATLLTATAQTYPQLLVYQLVVAVGVGSIVSVGFSVVTDFIPPHRRGLMLSIWGLFQGGGGGGGSLLGSLLGAHNWRLPFLVIAAAGFGLAVLYAFAYEPKRGGAEPALASIFAGGGRYEHRIKLSDLRDILARRSNLWLILQGFLSTLAFGALVWRPRLFIARVEAEGYGLETATMVGNMLSLLFESGFYFGLVSGHAGDRWQRSNPRARAMICTVTSLAAIPFHVALFFIPLTGLAIPAQAGLAAVVLATLTSIVTNGWVAAAFGVALVAIALAVADGPNRSALITDVNLPEHRGTVAGLNTLAAGLGLALGSALAGVTFGSLSDHFGSPLNIAIGLALFQLFFLPAGLFYYLATRSTPGDIAMVERTLHERGQAAGR
jgi:MFS family permease